MLIFKLFYLFFRGGNSLGQLGYGDTPNRGDNANEMGDYLPFVNVGIDAISIHNYGDSICVLTTNFSVKCWFDFILLITSRLKYL